VFRIFENTTPLVEGISVDEAFLDVGGLGRVSGTPVDIAVALRRQVRDEVGLAISVGVACTKFLAKVASAVSKPDGLLVVPPGEELAFLHPLPVQRLWGVGPKTTEKLHERGVFHVGDVAGMGEAQLISMLGPAAGRQLFALSHNRDARRVTVGQRRSSIGSQHAIGWGKKDAATIDATLAGLVDRVTRRMRKAERVGRTVVLRIRHEDSSRISRSHSLLQATAHTPTILATAHDLLDSVQPLIDEHGITLVGIAVSNLGDHVPQQLALPFDAVAAGCLDRALDQVRERFGTASITRATQIGRDPGLTVPMLPD
jgi:DNA polymerase-4